ncbi:hypothetical protein Agabi119p4_9729 [Agaricus bisporus var. burnettii]|uniref:Uncharacterized protein n=1 Tax=Agaricus bisporus var. burnettii TaxID=192524 RepID=A0A8H7C3T2_AGABI|nr:hypothetical protein Agabi119p4_9729 [Agaricus bisporus var. burnettii]
MPPPPPPPPPPQTDTILQDRIGFRKFCQSERPSRRLRGPNLQTHPFTIPVYSQNPSTRPLILKLLRISITHFSQLLSQLSCPYFSDSPGLKKPTALGRIQSYRPTFRIESVTHIFRRVITSDLLNKKCCSNYIIVDNDCSTTIIKLETCASTI